MSTHRLEKCQSLLHHMYVSTVLSTAHICTAQQSVSVSRRRQVGPPQQKMIVVWSDGWDVVSTAVPTRPRNLFTVPSVRRPEIRGKAHHRICPVPGPVNLSTQDTLCLVLYTVAACARTLHVVSGVEWRSNVMRCRPPPLPTQARMLQDRANTTLIVQH